MNQRQLIKAICQRTGGRPKDVGNIVGTLFDIVTEQVTAGNTVAVTNFCSWTPVDRPSRKSRNPQTGERITLPPRRDVRVRALPRFKEIVRDGDPTISWRKRVPTRRRTEPPEKSSA